MPHFRLTLAYDGTDFAGSQIQPDQRTVQGELQHALNLLTAGPGGTIFAGRTDRGVHAVGQVVAMGLPAWSGTGSELLQALNGLLPGDVRATQVAICRESFNPRFEAVWREYRYWITVQVHSPFLGRYAWNRRTEPDAKAMRAGAARLLGVHDFASFAGGGEGVPWSQRATKPNGTSRTIFRCDCRAIQPRVGPTSDEAATVLEIRVAADGFLPHMVRNIVGALLDIGQGRRDPDWIDHLLAQRDRRSGSTTAPAHGLTLARVGFGADHLDDD